MVCRDAEHETRKTSISRQWIEDNGRNRLTNEQVGTKIYGKT